MATVGIIGLGSMGNMLAQALLRTKAVAPEELSFDETIARVARKGGVTEAAIQALGRDQTLIFDRVFENTLENHRVKKARMEAEYRS